MLSRNHSSYGPDGVCCEDCSETLILSTTSYRTAVSDRTCAVWFDNWYVVRYVRLHLMNSLILSNFPGTSQQ